MIHAHEQKSESQISYALLTGIMSTELGLILVNSKKRGKHRPETQRNI